MSTAWPMITWTLKFPYLITHSLISSVFSHSYVCWICFWVFNVFHFLNYSLPSSSEVICLLFLKRLFSSKAEIKLSIDSALLGIDRCSVNVCQVVDLFKSRVFDQSIRKLHSDFYFGIGIGSRMPSWHNTIICTFVSQKWFTWTINSYFKFSLSLNSCVTLGEFLLLTLILSSAKWGTTIESTL